MRRAAIALTAALLAGCAGKPATAPRPAPPAVSPPPQASLAGSPAPAAEDWPDRPLSAGEWSYRSDPSGSEARFAGFGLRCDSARRQVVLSRDGAAGPVRLRTSYGERALSAGTALAASDPLLDQLAFSRGRFAVEAEGVDPLVVPARAEPGRVVEDCRG